MNKGLLVIALFVGLFFVPLDAAEKKVPMPSCLAANRTTPMSLFARHFHGVIQLVQEDTQEEDSLTQGFQAMSVSPQPKPRARLKRRPTAIDYATEQLYIYVQQLKYIHEPLDFVYHLHKIFTELGAVIITPEYVAAALKEKNIDVNMKDETKHSALHFAASLARVDVIKTLCLAGADVNAVSEALDTPLHQAAECAPRALENQKQRESLSRYVSACQALINAKARLDAKNKDGKTPYMLNAAVIDLAKDKIRKRIAVEQLVGHQRLDSREIESTARATDLY